jgi:predicted Mrr-cat superfamily restriction endonuclease
VSASGTGRSAIVRPREAADAGKAAPVPAIWGLHHNGGLPLVEEGWVAIGWVAAGDLGALPADRDAFKAHLRERYPDKSGPWIANAAGQLLRFRHVMAAGDLVVHPDKRERTINVGRIAGPYVHDPERSARYPNGREVDWLATDIPRDVFTRGFRGELGSALSVFAIRNHADEVLEALS